MLFCDLSCTHASATSLNLQNQISNQSLFKSPACVHSQPDWAYDTLIGHMGAKCTSGLK